MGGRAPAQPLVPALLVPHRRGATGAAHRPDRDRVADAGDVHAAAGLDALAVLEEHLSQGWAYDVDVLIDAAPAEVARWLPRSLGILSPSDDGRRTRLRASTANPGWYAGRLAVLPYAFHVHGSAELRQATADLGRRLLASGPPTSALRSRPDPGRFRRPRLSGR